MVAHSSRLDDQPTVAFCAESQLAYLEVGTSGRAIVLLHGWGAFKELWWSTLVMLAPHMHAFAPDMPGHGESPLIDDSGMKQIAVRIARFCAARQLSSICLVGHSMGGNVALELILAYPDLVERLVLVDPAAHTSDMPVSAYTRVDSVHTWTALRAGIAVARRLHTVGRRVPHIHRGGFLLPTLRRAMYMARHDANALHRLLDSLFASSVGARLAEVQVPTLVISGEFDPLVPPILSRRVAQAIPGARYVVVRGAGHNPMDERPRAFQQALLSFLQERS